MTQNLIPIKAFLGKYYPELVQSASQHKYVNSGLARVFEQRFSIQSNKTQMIVDPTIPGLIAISNGNEITVSQELYDHPNVEISNSMEKQEQQGNPKGLYSPEYFSTISYLVCQNHTMFNITGPVDEPIYVKYKSDFESFYNAVLIFNIDPGIDIEIVEEFESHCATNVVINYLLHPTARLNVSTFYENTVSALSYCLRNVILQDSSKYNHFLFGKGSSTVVDESKLHANNNSSIELLGCVNTNQHEFHCIVNILPGAQDYNLFMDHRHVVYGEGRSTFTPNVVGHLPTDAQTNISSLELEEFRKEYWAERTTEFLSPIFDRANLERTVGAARFYNNKTRFMQFQ